MFFMSFWNKNYYYYYIHFIEANPQQLNFSSRDNKNSWMKKKLLFAPRKKLSPICSAANWKKYIFCTFSLMSVRRVNLGGFTRQKLSDVCHCLSRCSMVFLFNFFILTLDIVVDALNHYHPSLTSLHGVFKKKLSRLYVTLLHNLFEEDYRLFVLKEITKKNCYQQTDSSNMFSIWERSLKLWKIL